MFLIPLVYTPCFEEIDLNIRNQLGCFSDASFLKMGIYYFFEVIAGKFFEDTLYVFHFCVSLFSLYSRTFSNVHLSLLAVLCNYLIRFLPTRYVSKLFAIL